MLELYTRHFILLNEVHFGGILLYLVERHIVLQYWAVIGFEQHFLDVSLLKTQIRQLSDFRSDLEILYPKSSPHQMGLSGTGIDPLGLIRGNQSINTDFIAFKDWRLVVRNLKSQKHSLAGLCDSMIDVLDDHRAHFTENSDWLRRRKDIHDLQEMITAQFYQLEEL